VTPTNVASNSASNAARKAAGATIKRALASLFVYLVASHASAAQVLSDRVVILENDARSHTVQHTLITTTAQVTLDLPLSVIPQRTRFGGPERATFAEDNQNNPQRVALRSGSAFTRYRHQYGEAVTPLSENSYRLQAQSWPDQLEVDLEELTPEAIESVQAWVFPGTAEVLDWRLIAEEGTTSVTGEWSFEDNTLMWTQTGVASVELQIDYRINPPDTAAAAEVTRTAKALLQSPDTIWEVAGYTDNAGARSLNRELSTKRAEAARQFLLLRGVPAGSVRAEGYGEQDPIADNATSEGRLINRRIELREWYAGQETPPANRTSE